MAEAAAQDNPAFPMLCFILVTFPVLSRPLFKIFQQGIATKSLEIFQMQVLKTHKERSTGIGALPRARWRWTMRNWRN